MHTNGKKLIICESFRVIYTWHNNNNNNELACIESTETENRVQSLNSIWLLWHFATNEREKIRDEKQQQKLNDGLVL